MDDTSHSAALKQLKSSSSLLIKSNKLLFLKGDTMNQVASMDPSDEPFLF